MPLKLLPIILEDFEVMANHGSLYAPGDDLIAPPTSPLAWPVATQADATRRLAHHMATQRVRFLEDPSVRYVKVIDDASGEIISIARWHWYPQGYVYEKEVHWEIEGYRKGVEGEGEATRGMNWELSAFMLGTILKRRLGQGQPAWVLMHMITRQSQRGRGAAGMLIDYGVEQAEKAGVPAYLEASAAGKPVYARHGFEQVGDLTPLDMRPYGLEITFNVAFMAHYPEGGRRNGEKVVEEKEH